MTAYSFQRQFVAPICLGLGRDVPPGFEVGSGLAEQEPKLQTIRAVGKRHHAPVGGHLQLYYGMRTKKCFQIGVARCWNVSPIKIHFGVVGGREPPWVTIDDGPVDDLDAFARKDGFPAWSELDEFWSIHHPGVHDFAGLLFRWERIT